MKPEGRRKSRRFCGRCGKRPAKFRFRGRIKVDKDHDLCSKCFDRSREKERARGLRRKADAGEVR